MALTRKGIITIDKLDSDAMGIARDGDDGLRLPYVCAGDVIEYEAHSYRNKTSYILKQIITPSIDRIVPVCRYYTKCGGCNLQHVNQEFYNQYKDSLVQNILDQLDAVHIMPKVIKLENPARRRVNLFFKKQNDRIRCGFFKFRKDEICDIDECTVVEQEISDIIPAISLCLQNIISGNISGEIHILKAENGLCMSINCNEDEYIDDVKKRKLAALARNNGVKSLIFKVKGNICFKYEVEKPYVVFAEEKIYVNAENFLQPVKESDQVITTIILDLLGSANTKLADLFSGRGTYSILLAKFGYNVSCYENDMEALSSLSVFAKNHSNIELQKRDLYHNPLSGDELSRFDAIVMNPPRTGAYQQILSICDQPIIGKIIYVSCNPKSFMVDAKLLERKYRLTSLVALDQFQYTNHLELIACFELR